jgi:hypothetical protein
VSTEPLLIEADPSVSEHTCGHCGERFQRVTAFVYRGRDAHAVYFASCYHHDGHEVFIDAVFSPTWEEGVDDHVTFGCRVGPIEGQTSPAASLTTAAAAFSDKPLFGLKLSREQALTHPLLGAFWSLVDHVLVNDPVVRRHVYGPGATFA